MENNKGNRTRTTNWGGNRIAVPNPSAQYNEVGEDAAEIFFRNRLPMAENQPPQTPAQFQVRHTQEQHPSGLGGGGQGINNGNTNRIAVPNPLAENTGAAGNFFERRLAEIGTPPEPAPNPAQAQANAQASRTNGASSPSIERI